MCVCVGGGGGAVYDKQKSIPVEARAVETVSKIHAFSSC